MELPDEPRGFRWERPAVVALILIALLLVGVIFLGWLEKFAIFGTFHFAVERIVDASGLSIYLVKGVLAIALVPFFLAVREIGKLPLFKGVGRFSKTLAWAILVVYTSAYFFAMFLATKDNYFRHLSGKEVKATKFYALTPEGIRFFDTDGVDPKYGIALQPVTPAIIANLERAKRGDVAKILVVKSLADVTFFDPLTGQAKVWFCQPPDGEVRLFSTSGFDPETGQSLQPVTPEFVEILRTRRAAVEGQQAAERRRSEEIARSLSAEAERVRLGAERMRTEAREKAFRDRYLNPGVQRSGDGARVAVFVLDQSGGVSALRDEFGRALRERGIDCTDGLFRPAFVADGNARRLFAGDATVAKRLRLADRVTAVVAINASRRITAAGAVDADLKTATVTVEVKCVNVVTFTSCGTGGFTVRGVGFSDDAALKNGLSNAGSDVQELVKSLAL